MQRSPSFVAIPLEDELPLDDPAQRSAFTPSNTPLDDNELNSSGSDSSEDNETLLTSDNSDEENPRSNQPYNLAEALKGIELGLAERFFFNAVLNCIHKPHQTIDVCRQMLKKNHDKYLTLNITYPDTTFNFFKTTHIKRLKNMYKACSEIRDKLAVPRYLVLYELTQLLKEAIKEKERLIYEGLANTAEYRKNINKLHEAGMLERINIGRNEYATLLKKKATLKEELPELKKMEETLTTQSLADRFVKLHNDTVTQIRLLGDNLNGTLPDVSSLNNILSDYRLSLQALRETIQSMCEKLLSNLTAIEFSHKLILGLVEKTSMIPKLPTRRVPDENELKSPREGDVTDEELAKIRAKHLPLVTKQIEEHSSPTMKNK